MRQALDLAAGQTLCNAYSFILLNIGLIIEIRLLTKGYFTVSEEVLIERLLARDEQALQYLYRQYSRSLSLVIFRIVRDETLTQDVLQEGLLKVWLTIDSYDPQRGRLYTWMARVCANHAIDLLRSRGYRAHQGYRSLDVSAAQQAPAAATFNPDHLGLRELTGRLAPRQREVIDLLYFEGYTQAEAAQQLGLPLGTVKTLARAALQGLARLVGSRPKPTGKKPG